MILIPKRLKNTPQNSARITILELVKIMFLVSYFSLLETNSMISEKISLSENVKNVYSLSLRLIPSLSMTSTPFILII